MSVNRLAYWARRAWAAALMANPFGDWCVLPQRRKALRHIDKVLSCPR